MTFCGFFQSEVASTKEELIQFLKMTGMKSILFPKIQFNNQLNDCGLLARTPIK